MNVTVNGYYDSSTLSWVLNTGFVQSEFIDCEYGDVVTLSVISTYSNMVVFKNASDVIISGITVGTGIPRSVTVPKDAVKFSANHLIRYFYDCEK